MISVFKRMPTCLNVSASLTLSFIQIVVAVSFAGFLFTGSLASYATMAVYPILLGAIVCQLFTSLFSTLPIAISPPQDEPLPVYAVMVASIVSGISMSHDLFPTVLVTIAFSTIATGLSFFLLGYFKLGNLIRFIPYPVIVGYLSSVGWLLIVGSLKKCLGQDISIDDLSMLFSLPILLTWLPVIVYAALLLWAVDRFRNPLTLPGLVVVGLLLFYAVVFLADIPFSTLRDHGFLFEGFHPESSLDYFKKIVVSDIDWHVIGDQIGNMIIAVLVCAFSLLLLATSLEHETNTDIDFNNELRTAGVGNLLSGLCGGVCCYISAVDTLLNKKLQSTGRTVGLLTTLFNVLFFMLGMRLISYIPRCLLFGIMLYLGLTLAKKWLYDARGKLSKTDFSIVISIVLVVAFTGLLRGGVLAGFLISIGLFVVNYSRISTVKYVLTGKNLRSSTKRGRVSSELLSKHGDEILYIKLQGYLFFGTSYSLVDYITTLIQQSKSQIKFIIFDFERVFAIDTSACSSFDKIKRDALKRNVTMILTELNAVTKNTFEQSGIVAKKEHTLIFRSTYDSALEYCEKKILKKYQSAAVEDVEKQVYFQYDDSTWKKFFHYFEKITLLKGAYLFHQGDISDGLFYILSGSIVILLEPEKGPKRQLTRLSPGYTFGDISMYLNLPRAAAARAEEECVLFKLTQEQLLKMEHENPTLAIDFHRVNIHYLSEHLLSTCKLLEIQFH